MRLTGAILVGGRATRFDGVEKPRLRVDGRPILDRQLAVLAPLCEEVVIVVGEADQGAFSGSGARVIRDHRHGQGPLAGLEAALLDTAGDAVLVVAGDMPLLSSAALALVAGFAPAADAVVPRLGERVEPLHARYHRRVLPRVQAHLDRGARALHRLLAELTVAWLDEAALRAVDPDLASLENVNTRDDLARIETRLRRG